MRDHPSSPLASLNLPAIERDIARIPQSERVRLAILLVRDIDQDHCIMPLRRLANQANELSALLLRDRFERECG